MFKVYPPYRDLKQIRQLFTAKWLYINSQRYTVYENSSDRVVRSLKAQVQTWYVAVVWSTCQECDIDPSYLFNATVYSCNATTKLFIEMVFKNIHTTMKAYKHQTTKSNCRRLWIVNFSRSHRSPAQLMYAQSWSLVWMVYTALCYVQMIYGTYLFNIKAVNPAMMKVDVAYKNAAVDVKYYI